jgi:hypothetical protein
MTTRDVIAVTKKLPRIILALASLATALLAGAAGFKIS